MKFFPLLLTLLLSISAFAQSTPEATLPSLQSLLPLRSCAIATSKLLDDGVTSREGMSSDDENSFYFLNCDDDYSKGNDHYVFTPRGVYYFFIKHHKDHRSGFEATQFRLRLEDQTYYFKSNVINGMENLYDSKGNNLSAYEANESKKHIDPSVKNQVLNYYMKVIVGKSDMSAAVIALPVSGERMIKARSCMRERVLKLGASLMYVYQYRSERRLASAEELATYRIFIRDILLTPACETDLVIRDQFSSYLKSFEGL